MKNGPVTGIVFWTDTLCIHAATNTPVPEPLPMSSSVSFLEIGEIKVISHPGEGLDSFLRHSIEIRSRIAETFR